MNVNENDTEDIIERKYLISKFIYTFFSSPKVFFVKR